MEESWKPKSITKHYQNFTRFIIQNLLSFKKGIISREPWTFPCFECHHSRQHGCHLLAKNSFIAMDCALEFSSLVTIKAFYGLIFVPRMSVLLWQKQKHLTYQRPELSDTHLLKESELLKTSPEIEDTCYELIN